MWRNGYSVAITHMATASTYRDITGLKKHRESVGLTQADLGRIVGVSRFLISKIETGQVFYEDVAHGTIVRIVRALNRRGLVRLTTDDLFPVTEKAVA